MARTTFIARLWLTGLIAPMAIDGTNFLDYVKRILVAMPPSGDIVLADNRSSHQSGQVREAIEAAGATLCFVPPYSPDFDLIEKVFSKLETLLHKLPRRLPTRSRLS